MATQLTIIQIFLPVHKKYLMHEQNTEKLNRYVQKNDHLKTPSQKNSCIPPQFLEHYF